MEDFEELELIMSLISQERDLIKGWWLTLTSVGSAFIVGGILAFISGKISTDYQNYLIISIISTIPILLTFLTELFFRLIEINEKAKLITIAFWKDHTQQKKFSFDSAINLFEMNYKSVPKGEHLSERYLYAPGTKLIRRRFIAPLVLSLYIPIFLFFFFFFFPPILNNSTLILDRLSLQWFILLIFAITLIIYIPFFIYLGHKRVIRIIKNWPDKVPWI